MAVGSGKPGTELIVILAELGIAAAPNCPCKRRAQQMDVWGVTGCESNRETIAAWLRLGQENWGWLSRIRAAANVVRTGRFLSLNWSDPYPGLVAEAIQRARGTPLTWAYGVMTVPQRRKDLLPRTLDSLANGGFDKPRLFVDNLRPGDAIVYEDRYHLEVTPRWPAVKAWSNWILSVMELVNRNPNADRYTLFQDDILCSRNLKAYLEHTTIPAKGYCNLITYPENLSAGKWGEWYRPSQIGRGAQGYVFSREAVTALLSHAGLITRPLNGGNWQRNIDGGVGMAMRREGWVEHVHNPSLLYHTGIHSVIGNDPQPEIRGFMGEDFDLMTLRSARR